MQCNSEFFAAIIVAYRLLGLNKNEAENAMKELALRRINGDSFEYEEWIEKKIFEIKNSLKLKSGK